MAQNRVPENNYKVLLLEDGTGSYTNFNSNYSADGAISTLNENIELINNKYTASWNRELAPYEDGTAGNITKWAQSVAYATRSNVEYWLQFPEMLSSNDSTVASMLDAESSSELKINFVKKNLTQIYSQISVEKQSIFKNILIDNNISNIMNFNNSKPTLMITGISYTGEQMGVTSTSTVLTPSEGSSFTLADKG